VESPRGSSFARTAISGLTTQGVTRRRFLQFAAATAGAGALAACSTGGSGASASGSRKLSFLYFGSASLNKAVEAEYAPFVKANPQIDFGAQGISSANWADFANTVSTRIAGGSAPDVIDIATEGVGIFRSKKLVVPLDDYIAKNKEAIDSYYNDMNPSLKALSDKFGNPGGTTYYIPGGFNTNLLYCNVEVFQKAGVELPGTDDWTWDDFTDAAKKIKAKTGAYIAPFTNAQFQEILPWLLTNGASTLNADWTKPAINTPEGIEAAEYCKMMHDAGYAPAAGGTFDQPTMLSQGKLACLPGGRSPTVDMVRLGIVDKVQIVKWPMKKQNGSPVGWDNFPILSSSQDKDDAWKFVEYLTTKEAVLNLLKLGGTNVPARRSIVESDAFLKNAPKGSELLYAALDYATPIPGPARGADVQDAIEQAWLQILQGNVSASAGLSQLSDKISGLL
jgi:multiple sugar transport system substrate-binding protein